MTPAEHQLRHQNALFVSRWIESVKPSFHFGRLPEFHWPLFVVRERPYDRRRDCPGEWD